MNLETESDTRMYGKSPEEEAQKELPMNGNTCFSIGPPCAIFDFSYDTPMCITSIAAIDTGQRFRV